VRLIKIAATNSPLGFILRGVAPQTLKSFVYMQLIAQATIRSTRAQDDNRQRVAREVDILHVCEVFGQPLGPQLLLGRDLLCRFDTYAFGLSLDHLARDIPSKLATEDATPIPADVYLAKEELNSSHLSRLAASPVLERGDPRPPSETNVFVTAMHAEGPSRSERYNKLNDEDNRVALIVQHHKPRHFGSIAIVQSIRAAGYNRINIHQQALAHCQRCEGCIRHTKHHSAVVRHVAIPRPLLRTMIGVQHTLCRTRLQTRTKQHPTSLQRLVVD
jgi:hypothetical protein